MSDNAVNNTWTIKRCLTWTEGYLASRGEERPRLAAEWLMCAATGKRRIELYMSFDEPLSKEELDIMHKGVVRRAKGEPLQYITGETSFRTLDVYCEPGVLIPRPETETLVELVIEYLKANVLAVSGGRRARVELPWNDEVERERAAEREKAAEAASQQGAERLSAGLGDPDSTSAGESAPAGEPELAGDPVPAIEPGPAAARILEVGCGTGCITLSLASELSGQVSCVATDIEPRACALAEKNRERAGISADAVSIREGDLVSPVTADEAGTFDVLVSNPPYVPTRVMSTLPREVASFEPGLALDGGADGLDVFRRLLDVAPRMLRPGGLFACELFEEALDTAAALCRAAGLDDVRVVEDLTHRPRFVVARAAGHR